MFVTKLIREEWLRIKLRLNEISSYWLSGDHTQSSAQVWEFPIEDFLSALMAQD
jgi:hypothetical protein